MNASKKKYRKNKKFNSRRRKKKVKISVKQRWNKKQRRRYNQRVKKSLKQKSKSLGGQDDESFEDWYKKTFEVKCPIPIIEATALLDSLNSAGIATAGATAAATAAAAPGPAPGPAPAPALAPGPAAAAATADGDTDTAAAAAVSVPDSSTSAGSADGDIAAAVVSDDFASPNNRWFDHKLHDVYREIGDAKIRIEKCEEDMKQIGEFSENRGELDESKSIKDIQRETSVLEDSARQKYLETLDIINDSRTKLEQFKRELQIRIDSGKLDLVESICSNIFIETELQGLISSPESLSYFYNDNEGIKTFSQESIYVINTPQRLKLAYSDGIEIINGTYSSLYFKTVFEFIEHIKETNGIAIELKIFDILLYKDVESEDYFMVFNEYHTHYTGRINPFLYFSDTQFSKIKEGDFTKRALLKNTVIARPGLVGLTAENNVEFINREWAEFKLNKINKPKF